MKIKPVLILIINIILFSITINDVNALNESNISNGCGRDFYIDPGTGSLIIQAAIGVVAGGLVALKLYWNRVKQFFKKKTKKPKEDGSTE